MSADKTKTGFARILQVLLAVLIFAFSPLLIVCPQAAQAEEPAANESDVEYWAVVIGVYDYQRESYDMSTNYSDAEDLNRILSNAWGGEHVQLLVNEESTKAGIEDSICSWLKENADENDVALIYFHGHGGNGYLCPYDAGRNIDISNSEIGMWIDELETDKIIVIIDACHSGALIPRLSKPGRIILTSCQNDQLSYGSLSLNSGVFSYFIREAFYNALESDISGDHVVSAEEVFCYSNTSVVGYWGPDNVYQNPQISDQYDGEMELILWAEFDLNPHESVLNISVDGTIYSYDELPKAFFWKPGSVHNYEIHSTNPVWISLPAQEITHGGEYHFVYLNIESDYGEPQGEGWYLEGTEATINVTSPNGVLARNVFTGWRGEPITDNESTTTILMSRPKTVVAKWHKDYSQLYMLIGGIVAALVVITALGAHFFVRRRRKIRLITTPTEVALPSVQQDQSISQQ